MLTLSLKKWGIDLKGDYSLKNIIDKIKKVNSFNKNQFNNVVFGGRRKPIIF